MDIKFASQLNTTLQEVGRKGKLSPPESQDPADAALHEYYVADTGRAVFTKRCSLAKEGVIARCRPEDVEAIINRARSDEITSHGELLHTEHYLLTLKANSPVRAVDNDIFQLELVKAGVDPTVITACLDKARIKREPAKNFHIVTTVTR